MYRHIKICNKPICDLTHIKFPGNLHGIKFRSKDNADDIIWPNTLHTLIFGFQFNQNVDNVKWPLSLHTIIFGSTYNQPLDNVKFPQSLYNIAFDYEYNQSMRDIIWPKSLHKMTVNSKDIRLSDFHIRLPESLGIFILGKYNNRNICDDLIWPNNLYKLHFGCKYNHSIDHVKFPSSLTELNLNTSFNHNIDNVDFPASLEIIIFGQLFSHSIINVKFINIYIVHDYSNKITISSCNFPNGLHEIWHYVNNNPVIIYKKYVGQHTKSAIRY
jgi:hypothetical protein